YQHMQKLRGLESDRDYIKKEIKVIEKDINDLSTDKERLEKFAREKYLMKKENEDVFVIVKE
ncbi:MAG: FtsB family cell division protein, partial [bacterium]